MVPSTLTIFAEVEVRQGRIYLKDIMIRASVQINFSASWCEGEVCCLDESCRGVMRPWKLEHWPIPPQHAQTRTPVTSESDLTKYPSNQFSESIRTLTVIPFI